jgi:Protein of unknown function (DUF2505)
VPRSFEVSVESPASVEQVHGAFGEADYWSSRFAAFGTTTTVESLIVGPDGTVSVDMVQDLRQGGLPKLLTRFYPGDLKVLTTETWQPVGDRQVRGEVTIAAVGAPGSGRGAALLMPVGDGSQMTFNGIVDFKVPLVGGKIESYLGGQFAELISEIQRFTTAWIAGRD